MQVRLRIGSLYLSSASVIILLLAHIIYACVYHGEVLPMPMPTVVWAVVLAPFLGEGTAKLLQITKETK